ncbi:MAG: beta-propeller fold lactonase family protein [Anaerolineae bacterium]|nr:beta-propeller fold lactonase family protein [Anaerolineae bacterium]
MKRLHMCLPLILVLGMLGISFLIGGGKVAASDPPPEIESPVQQQPALTAPSGLPSAVNQVLAGTAVVAVFDDPSYVDTENTTSSESDNVQAGLAAMGHTVLPFTGIDETAWSTALAGADILVIPELENDSGLGIDLSLAARAVISDFVNSGGGLIEFDDGSSFLNPVFGFSLSHSGGNPSSITAAAVGTAFQGGPATLPSNNATWGLDSSTFPAGGLAIYSSGGNNAEVAWLPYGSGQIIYLGWDWYDAAPPGGQDGGWLDVLERAVPQVSGNFLGLFPAWAKDYDVPGATVVYTHTLLNLTGLTDTFTLALSGNLWPTTLPMTMTPVLTDGATLDLVLNVTIPASAASGDSDHATLVATSVTSPTLFSATATLNTVALCSNYITVTGRSAETMGDLDNLWEYGGQTFAVARVRLYSEDNDTLDAVLRGYDSTSGWIELASVSDVGNITFFDDVLFPGEYTMLNMQLDDTEDNDLIYYDYEFLVCRSPAVDVKPDTQQAQYAEPGATTIYTYTLTNYLMEPGQFDLTTSGVAWPTAVRTTGGAPLSQTPVLSDLEVYTFTVWVDVPAGAAPGDWDDGLVTASRVGQAAINNSGGFRTTALSGQYGYVFVPEGNRIEVLDTVLHAAVGVIDTSPYGDAPFLGGLSPDGSRLYVSLLSSDRILIVDTATQTPFTQTIAVGDGPHNVAFTPDGAYAFVPNRGSGTLSVIDTAVQAVTKTLATGSSPMIVVTSPCLGKAYVTNRDSGSVSVIDTAALTVTTTITGFNSPWGIVISPYGRWAYVTNQGDGSIGVINTATDALIATWDIQGDWLQMLDISPDGRTLYVVDANSGAMLVVDAFSGEVLDIIPAERSGAWYVESFPAGAGDYAYFSRPYEHSVAVVDTATQSIVKTIPLQDLGSARGLALFPMESACLAPDGVVVAPSAPHRVAQAGETVIFHEYVTNLSAVTDTFALALSTIPWTTTLSANTTGPLAPGAIFAVTATVELPASTPLGALQTVTLTVTGTSLTDSAALTASVLRPGFVFNDDENVIHVVDTFYHLDSGIAIDVSAYGYIPFRGVLSPDAQQLYVGLRDGNRVLIVDTATLTPTGALPVGNNPQDVAFSPDGDWAFVTNRGDGTLTVIDTAVPTVTATLPVGNEPMSLAAACSDKLYVALRAGGAVAVVDTAVMTVTKVITGFVAPHGLTLTPACDRVYVSNQGGDSIGVIDASSDSLIATWPVPGAEWLSDVDVSVDGQRLYVADADTGDVYVLDTATGAVVATVTGTGWTAWEVEAFPLAAGPFVYATFPYDGWVGVLDTTSNTLEKVFRLGDGGDLRGMALFPPTRLCRNVYLPLVMRNFGP